jgi:S1-C subfamily serine protease
MTPSRSDRPYGQFPRGDVPEPAPAPQAPRRFPLRERIVARLRGPLALVSLLALSAFLVSAVQTGGLVALRAQQEQPTPEPTPQLAAAIYEHVAPSVVQVISVGASGEPSSGAGVIVDDMADILTSLHIIDGGTDIRVMFSDGTSSPVEVVARLPDRDIAVLRALAPPAQFQPATMGNPGALSIGDPAFVIGHPFGLTGSLSTGVISGLDRSMSAPNLAQPLTGLIQFDAAVNPGNSGGPLVDRRGEVVGIVTGLVNPAGKVFSGVGFAVTIDSAAAGLGIPPD